MPLSTVLEQLEVAIRLFDDFKFTSDDVEKKLYATEYLLILIGQNMVNVMAEIEDYVINTPSLVRKYGALVGQNQKKREEYFREKFRNSFPKDSLLRAMNLFIQIRNKLEHKSHLITIEDQDSISRSIENIDKYLSIINRVKSIFEKSISDVDKINLLFGKSSLADDLTWMENIKEIFDKADKERSSVLKRKGAPRRIEHHVIQDNPQRTNLLRILSMLFYELDNIKKFSRSGKRLIDKENLYATSMALVCCGAHADILLKKKEYQKEGFVINSLK
jgi:hypothetical protein